MYNRNSTIRVLVAHPGTQHAFRLATELHRQGVLGGLYTGLAIGAGSTVERLSRFLSESVVRRISNRIAPELPARLIHNKYWLESVWQMDQVLGRTGQTFIHRRNEQFQRRVPDRAILEANVVIGFDTSSWILADRCEKLGRPFVMVQTIGHPDAWAALAPELARRFPDWNATVESRLAIVREAEQVEHNKATLVVGSSSFTRNTLETYGVAGEKVLVIPHGVDPERFTIAKGGQKSRPFRFLFAGSLSARKGVPLLLEAWKSLSSKDAELWLIGPASVKVLGLLKGIAGTRVFGDVPNAQVSSLMQQCDVLVFPSYFEGFGLVILEAMASGLPVITTDGTAGPDLIPSPGEGGWVIPRGDQAALKKAMASCLEKISECKDSGAIARRIAERNSWRVYGERWVSVLTRVVGDYVKPRARTGVLLAHPGTQYSFRLAEQLAHRERLGAFYTSVAIGIDGPTWRNRKWLPRSMRRPLQNRGLSRQAMQHTRLQPRYEIFAALQMWPIRGNNEAILHRRNRCFQESIPLDSIHKSAVVVGFDTSSWLLAQWCRDAGVPFVLDQSIGHPDSKARIYRQVYEAYPEWAAGLEKRHPAVREAEQIEHDLADVVVVASSFAFKTLAENGVDEKKIRLIPYGVDLDRFACKRAGGAGPLRVVFVGSVTARKGVPVLLDAWRRLRPGGGAELWFVGPIDARSRARVSGEGVRVVGAVSHYELAGVLRQCDVLALPSYFEGFGLVIPEAMASGLPVIATAATAAPDIFDHGEGGWIVPVGDAAALADVLQQCLSKPDETRAMGQTARRIIEKQTWDAYGDRWIDLLDSLVGGQANRDSP
jgi:glycosyltransferase involved in cell wall biosynthesis